MYAPSMHAERSVYRTSGRYVNHQAFAHTSASWRQQESQAAVLPVVSSRPQAANLASGQVCSDLFYTVCETEAISTRETCRRKCDAVCSLNGVRNSAVRGGNGNVECAICRQELPDCETEYASAIAECRSSYQCDRGLSCQTDLKLPQQTLCCQPGQWACGGSCRHPCSPGSHPDSLPCECACDDGYIQCDNECVLIDRNTSHCGGCGKACGPGELCCQGTCIPCENDGCCGQCGLDCRASGQICCVVNGQLTCVEQNTDDRCGSCGNNCREQGKVCVQPAPGGNRYCRCPDNAPPCGPNGDCCKGKCCNGVCFTADMLKTDSKNCGDCGVVCDAGLGLTCQSGICKCRPGLTLCGGKCVNTMTDVENCSRCGGKCLKDWCDPDGNHCTKFGSCADGDCQCPPNWTKHKSGGCCWPNWTPCNDFAGCCEPGYPVCTTIRRDPTNSRFLCCAAGSVGNDVTGNDLQKYGVCCPAGLFGSIRVSDPSQLTCCLPANLIGAGDGRLYCAGT